MKKLCPQIKRTTKTQCNKPPNFTFIIDTKLKAIYTAKQSETELSLKTKLLKLRLHTTFTADIIIYEKQSTEHRASKKQIRP